MKPKAYYAREISTAGAKVFDATPYGSRDEALAEIIKHMRAGGIVKGWIEDQDGNMVMLPDDIAAVVAKNP